MIWKVETFLRERFLRDHAHLISPWDCTPSEAAQLTEILRRRNWLYWEKKQIAQAVDRAFDASVTTVAPVDKPPS